jgi:hypothetical protein
MSRERPAQPQPRARVDIVPLESSSQPFKFTVHVYGPDTPENRRAAEGLAHFAIREKFQGELPKAVHYTILFEG